MDEKRRDLSSQSSRNPSCRRKRQLAATTSSDEIFTALPAEPFLTLRSSPTVDMCRPCKHFLGHFASAIRLESASVERAKKSKRRSSRTSTNAFLPFSSRFAVRPRLGPTRSSGEVNKAASTFSVDNHYARCLRGALDNSKEALTRADFLPFSLRSAPRTFYYLSASNAGK
jgi:hypothetical protein